MFKKLFRKIKKTEDNQPDPIEEPKSRLLELLDSAEKNGLGKLYPILKPSDWVAKPHAVYIPWIGGKENPQVLMAFGWDNKENLTFFTNQKAEGMRKSDIYNIALKNISTYPSQIQISEIENHKLATASGQDFSAEKILDTNFLLELSSHLDSNELLISIPRRRCIMACGKNSSNDFLNTFHALHNYAWKDDSYGNAPIANGLFESKKGIITGYIPL